MQRTEDRSALQDVCSAALGMDPPGDEGSDADSASCPVSRGCLALCKRKKNDVPATERYSLCYTKDRVTRENTECRQRG